MSNYRAYILGDDGRITKANALPQCLDDATAIEAAKQFVDGHDVAVWDGARLVTKLFSKDKD